MSSNKNNVPKSLAKAATRNMKVIKNHVPSKKERIDRIIENRKNNKESSNQINDSKKIFLLNEAQRRNENYCTVKCFEKSVYSVEGIKVILRAPTNAIVGRYTHTTRCSKNTTIRDFIEKRIKRSINSTYEIYIATDKRYSLDDPISTITKYNHSNTLVD